MPKTLSLLLVVLFFLISCKDEAIDYSVKRPAALSLPEIKKDGNDETSGNALLKPISVEEAVNRSSEVFEGSTLSIDSSNHESTRMPVYLYNVKVTKRWKGNFAEESTVAFMSRSLKTSEFNKENVFFLMPVDSANVFASGDKLHWQWTFNAPQGISTNDSIKTLLAKALGKEP